MHLSSTVNSQEVTYDYFSSLTPSRLLNIRAFFKVASKLGFPLRFTWPRWMNAFLSEVLFRQLDTFVSTKLMDTFFFNRNENCDYCGLVTIFYKKVLSDYRKYCINCYIQLSTIISSLSMGHCLSYMFILRFLYHIILYGQYDMRTY